MCVHLKFFFLIYKGDYEIFNFCVGNYNDLYYVYTPKKIFTTYRVLIFIGFAKLKP